MSEIDLTEAWEEWHETCALDLCSKEHISQLCRVSNSLYRRATKKLNETTSTIEPYVPGEKESDFRRTFHIMEAECIPLGTKEERQRYKDRIFAGAAETGDVTGYFLRDSFRSYVKKTKNISYNKPPAPENVNPEEQDDWLMRGNHIRNTRDSFFREEEGAGPEEASSPDDDAGQPPENMSPSKDGAPRPRKRTGMPGNLRADDMDKDIAVESIDYRNIGNAANKYWSELTETDRAALYAYFHNISMSHPELLKKAGLGKSSFLQRPVVLLTQVRNRSADSLEKEEQPRYIRIFLDTLGPCYQEWEKTSELGKWIVAHFHYGATNGKKQRFSSGGPEI